MNVNVNANALIFSPSRDRLFVRPSYQASAAKPSASEVLGRCKPKLGGVSLVVGRWPRRDSVIHRRAIDHQSMNSPTATAGMLASRNRSDRRS